MRNKPLLQALWANPAWLMWLPPAFWAGIPGAWAARSGRSFDVSLAVGRWVVALVALAPFVWYQAWQERALLARHWRSHCGLLRFRHCRLQRAGLPGVQTVAGRERAFSPIDAAADGAAGRAGAWRRTYHTMEVAGRHCDLVRRRELDRGARQPCPALLAPAAGWRRAAGAAGRLQTTPCIRCCCGASRPR